MEDTYKEASSEVKGQELTALPDILKELHIDDENSIIYFGSSIQKNLNTTLNTMMENIQNKDINAIPEYLQKIIGYIRQFEIEKFNTESKNTWYNNVLTTKKSIDKCMLAYEDLLKDIHASTDALEKYRSNLLVYHVALDRLCDKNYTYAKKLIPYINASTSKLESFNTSDEKVTSPFKHLLERKVQNLKDSEEKIIHSISSIKNIQKLDDTLIMKISTILLNDIPLWITHNTETINILTSPIEGKVPSMLFSIENMKKEKDTIIHTIENTLRIAEESKTSRTDILFELNKVEYVLKSSLLGLKKR